MGELERVEAKLDCLQWLTTRKYVPFCELTFCWPPDTADRIAQEITHWRKMIHKDKDELRCQANLAEASLKARDVDEMIEVLGGQASGRIEIAEAIRERVLVKIKENERKPGWRTPKPNGVRTDFNGEITAWTSKCMEPTSDCNFAKAFAKL
jgi:hypothetical protein